LWQHGDHLLKPKTRPCHQKSIESRGESHLVDQIDAGATLPSVEVQGGAIGDKKAHIRNVHSDLKNSVSQSRTGDRVVQVFGIRRIDGEDARIKTEIATSRLLKDEKFLWKSSEKERLFTFGKFTFHIRKGHFSHSERSLFTFGKVTFHKQRSLFTSKGQREKLPCLFRSEFCKGFDQLVHFVIGIGKVLDAIFHQNGRSVTGNFVQEAKAFDNSSVQRKKK
jgi:hypothetical protein